MGSSAASFIRILNHPLKFRAFLLSNLPSAFFSGLKIVSAAEESCAVSVPYSWFSKNPFRSTYFACLAMAAEMSTGALASMHVYNRKPGISMLVVKLEAEYFKKATGLTTFICNDGAVISDAIEQSVATGEANTVKVKSTGTSSTNETVAIFQITWSFKIRTRSTSQA